MRLLPTLLAIIPLILTILSFIFTVLSTTSKQWAYQDFYAEDGIVVSLDQQITPLWTIYRSPFWTCGRGANATAGDYHVYCTRHSLTKNGSRACETLATYFADNDPAYGDTRQCQQIHMSASLLVSSSVFSGLSLLSILALSILSILSPQASASTPTRTRRKHHHINDGGAAAPSTTHTLLSSWTIFCLLVSAGLLFLAQCYGVLGLVQSAFPNGNYITNVPNAGNSGPWVQGKASVIYASVGWFAGCLAVAGVVGAWGVPSLVGLGSGGGEMDARVSGDGEGRE